VGIATDENRPALTVVCRRCNGSNPPATRFCQFCGARLEPSPSAPQSLPLPPPPAGRPVAGAPPDATPAETPAVRRVVSQASPGSLPPLPAQSSPLGGGAVVATGRYVPPADSAAAQLVVIAQDGSIGQVHALFGEHNDIGRTEGTILLPSDPFVSPRHARVSRREGRCFIRDLGSLNGVYLRLRQPELLHDGDLVLIGLEVLRFEIVSDSEKGFGPAVDKGTQVFGSPSSPRFARLCQRTVEGVTRDVFHICSNEVTIGRESGDIVFTADPFMSRRHAALARNPADGSFALRDLGSSNGTYLAIRGEVELAHGDHVRVGQHLFRLDVAVNR
jgi:pSer/pThr/pTyr-binding forkhead associated (FHA) protein